MKIEHIFTDEENEQIERFEKEIAKIENEYLEEFQKLEPPTATNRREYEMLVEQYKRDIRLRAFREGLSNAYQYSIGRIVVTAENEEESRELFKKYGGKNDGQ